MIIYSVVITDGYIPDIPLATTNREEALKFAKGWAKGWKYGKKYGDEYFKQEEDGSMEYSVTVIKTEVEEA